MFIRNFRGNLTVCLQNMACEQCSLGIHKLFSIFSDENNLLTFLEQHNLIKLEKKCSTCDSVIYINKNNLFTCDKQRTVKMCGGRKKKVIRCRFRESLIKGTFFEHSHIKLEDILQLAYWFILNRLTQTEVSEQLSIALHTVNDWYKYCREVVEEFLIENTEVIGGPGKVVEIHEAKLGKRKYNRGHVVEDLWVFGGIESDTKRSFMVSVPDITQETLIEQIKKFILPESKIITDCWTSYSMLSSKGYQHETANHSQNFVDPQMGQHSQNVENHWCEARVRVPKYGKRFFERYFALHFFIERYPAIKDRFHAFLLAAAKLYPPSE